MSKMHQPLHMTLGESVMAPDLIEFMSVHPSLIFYFYYTITLLCERHTRLSSTKPIDKRERSPCSTIDSPSSHDTDLYPNQSSKRTCRSDRLESRKLSSENEFTRHSLIDRYQWIWCQRKGCVPSRRGRLTIWSLFTWLSGILKSTARN